MVRQGQTSLRGSPRIVYPSHHVGRDLQSEACRKNVSRDGHPLATAPRKLRRDSETWARRLPVSDLNPSFSVDERRLRVSSLAR